MQRGFYYWKSATYELSGSEKKAIRDLEVEKLYVKFFEVEKSAVFGHAPVAKTGLRIYNYSSKYNYEQDSALSSVMERLEVVPTVFVRNEVLLDLTPAEVDTLADNMVYLIKRYFVKRIHSTSNFTEIQIDCDWTPKTQENYFRLLKEIKTRSEKKLSCTLRLYPYKYPDKMGVPPVDKAMLMCYNLNNPLKFGDRNSIQDNEELESYLRGAEVYPLHLDIALPLFSWIQVYQNGAFMGVLRVDPEQVMGIAEYVEPMWYEVRKETLIGDRLLRPGDMLKVEGATPEGNRETIRLLRKHVKFDKKTTITLFHLEDQYLNQTEDDPLDQYYSAFTRDAN